MWVQLVSKWYNSAKSCNISIQDHPRLTKSSAFSVKNPPWPDRIWKLTDLKGLCLAQLNSGIGLARYPGQFWTCWMSSPANPMPSAIDPIWVPILCRSNPHNPPFFGPKINIHIIFTWFFTCIIGFVGFYLTTLYVGSQFSSHYLRRS